MARRDTKRALLDSAKTLFCQKGFSAVGVREIAERANVNLGMIQYHYGSKAKLFVAAVQDMMSSGDTIRSLSALDSVGSEREENIQALARFLLLFMTKLLCSDGVQHCRLIYREVFAHSAESSERFESLVSEVSEEFTRPLETRLCEVISFISPHIPQSETCMHARSIISQGVFYFTNRPFIERVENRRVSEPETFEKIVKHIVRFSLTGIGVETSEIDEVIDNLGFANIAV